MAIKDYRVEVKIRNNWLLKKIEDLGYDSVADFCRKQKLNFQNVSAFVTFRTPAINKDGTWSRTFERIANALNCLPADICPPQHLKNALKKNRSSFEMSADEVSDLLIGSAEDTIPTIEHILKEEAVKTINEKLEYLTPKEERVIRMRFGLTSDGDERTLEEIGDEWNVGRERIRQIEAMALRKLKHPICSRQLREIAKDFGVVQDCKKISQRHYVPEWKKEESES